MKVSSVLAILGATALVVGGLLSQLASSHPDGLEWSVEKVTGSTEIERESPAWASDVQERTALLPDYAFKDSERGTSFSGVAGALAVLLLCFVIGLLLRRRAVNPADPDGKA